MFRINVSVLLLICLGQCPLCPAKEETQSLTSIQLDWSTAKSITSSGVLVSWSSREDSIALHLRRDKKSIQLDLMRNAAVYISTPDPNFVLVLERYASNEDRIFLYDFSTAGRKRIAINHDDSRDYVHLHFTVERLEGSRLWINEDQYAGTEKSRSRSIEVQAADGKYVVTRFAWHESP